MAQFSIEEDHDRNLRIITVRGRLTVAEMLERGKENLQGETALLYVLWDLSEAEGEELDTEQLREALRKLKPASDSRAGGKTAMVASGDLEFGIARMLEVFGEIEEFPINVSIFRNRAEAERWLFG